MLDNRNVLSNLFRHIAPSLARYVSERPQQPFLNPCQVNNRRNEYDIHASIWNRPYNYVK